MTRRRNIVEGEMFGAPVPGGWPNRGPFEAIRSRILRKRPQSGPPESKPDEDLVSHRPWKPGDCIRILTEGGSEEVVVVEAARWEGEFEVVTVCSPSDWKLFKAGGKPGGYWEEWKYEWPVEAIEGVDT